jgi:hypothetical protein
VAVTEISARRGNSKGDGSVGVVAGGGQRDVYVRADRARQLGSDGYIKVSHGCVHATMRLCRTQTQTTGFPAARRRFGTDRAVRMVQS